MKHDQIVNQYAQKENIWFVDDVEEIHTDVPLRTIFPVRSNLSPDLVYRTIMDDIYIGEVKQREGRNQISKAIKQINKYGYVLDRARIPHEKFIITGNNVYMVDGNSFYSIITK